MNNVHRLTSDIADGDGEAFARFYREKFGYLYAIAAKATGFDEQTCLDIVQDSMMRVIRYMKPFASEASLNNWLACVTRSVAIDHLRQQRRRQRRERKAMEARGDLIANDDGDLLERIEWLRHELRGLDRVSYEMLELRYHAGWTLAAIGQQLGLGIGAVHRRLARTVERLRKRSVQWGDEEP